MQFAELVEDGDVNLHVVSGEEVGECLFALLLYLAVLATQDGLNLPLRLCCADEVDPVGLHVLRVAGEYLHLVAALQLVAQRHEAVVDLGTDAMAAEEGVYLESEVEGRTACGHRLDLALWREDEYLGSEEVELDSVEEIHRVGLRVVENLLDGAQPVVELALVFSVLLSLLVFPVGGEALLGYLVHAVAAYLHLYPPPLLRHERDVQGLIAIRLGMGEPVAQPVGMTLIDFADGDIDIEAFVDFVLAVFRFEDDAYGQDVKDFVERHVLCLHLVPDGVRTLDACEYFIVDAHFVECLTDGRRELFEELVARLLGDGQFALYGIELLGVFEFEAEVLELCLDLVESQSVGQRCVDIERFAGYLVLLVGRLRL